MVGGYDMDAELSRAPTQRAIVEALGGASEPMQPQEIADVTDISKNSVQSTLRKMKDKGLVVQPGYGLYSLPEESTVSEDLQEYDRPAEGPGTEIASLFREEAELEILTDVKASAGTGTVVYPDEARHVVRVPRHFIANIIGFSPPRQVGIMFADGDSMEPTIRDEEMILYKPIEDVRTGGIYVLWRDTGLIVKRVQRLSGGGYRLISDNTYHNYTDETIVPEDGENGQAMINKETGRTVDLRVVGKVLFPKRDTDRLHVKQVAELIRGIVGGEVDPASLS